MKDESLFRKNFLKIAMAIAALSVSTATMAGAIERSSSGGLSDAGSQLMIVLIDIPLVGFASRRLVRMPVVFPVPAI